MVDQMKAHDTGLAEAKWNPGADPHAAADALEHQQMDEFGNIFFPKSALGHLEDGNIGIDFGSGMKIHSGEDPRLPRMPERPTLQDFFRHRFNWSQKHILLSAQLAIKNGCPEKIVLACLLHDISICGFLRSDHGYWGSQLIAPYVDEEVSWAIREHQACRFFADPDFNYEYPESYVQMFGPNYVLPAYIQEEYKRARAHKWYGSARTICVNDLYSFNPDDVVPPIEAFDDIIGRHFKTPKEGLGNDNSPASHMWRTIIRPSNPL
jgi:hypothetical protein